MFYIIGLGDLPLYESNFGTLRKEVNLNHHFFLHSSLDLVDEQSAINSQMFLKTVDRTGDYFVYGFVTPSYCKFLLMVDSSFRNEDSVKSFFNEVYELYVKNLANPLYEINSKIKSKTFDLRVKGIASKYL